jgi:hypothetical protein
MVKKYAIFAIVLCCLLMKVSDILDKYKTALCEYRGLWGCFINS